MLRVADPMNTNINQSGATTSQLRLKKNQTLVLSKPSGHQRIAIDLAAGLLRISTCHRDDQNDITLALMSPLECGTFHYPRTCQLRLEALAETNLSICFDIPQNIDTETDDFLSEWLLELHYVRNPAKAEERVSALLRLLAERFGKRTPEGMRLDFLLPHARIAEMIGTTRSTVSRTLSSMRKTEEILIDELREILIIYL